MTHWITHSCKVVEPLQQGGDTGTVGTFLRQRTPHWIFIILWPNLDTLSKVHTQYCAAYRPGSVGNEGGITKDRVFQNPGIVKILGLLHHEF